MIVRALRMQASSLFRDVVLLWMLVAAVGMSLMIATGVPAELTEASRTERAALAAPLGTILAVYGGVLAAVYGSFRYTIDLRDGVIAQRLMLQRRRVVLLARMPATAIAGAGVSLASIMGGHAALVVAMGGIPVDPATVGRTLVLGAAAALYGLGVGLVVQSHLVALFVAPLSLGAAPLIVGVWPGVASHLPLLTMLEALDFDVRAVGLSDGDRLGSPVATVIAAAWVALSLLGGAALFVRRDLN
ncbi:hypothetical protein RAC69_06665 [Microbacterium sp. LS_15]|uniref:hypothetical protein n=1 Tax=Microbacterium sp. LS_15 TaxID=3055790 RepID=UPI0035BF956E